MTRVDNAKLIASNDNKITHDFNVISGINYFSKTLTYATVNILNFT